MWGALVLTGCEKGVPEEVASGLKPGCQEELAVLNLGGEHFSRRNRSFKSPMAGMNLVHTRNRRSLVARM